MTKPSTPAVWASGKTFGFQPSSAQQAQGFDYIATVRPGTGAPITDDHDWPLNQVTTALKWVMDQIAASGLKSAAFMDVGTSSGQIPGMSDWQSGGDINNGWRKTPDGFIEQWGVTSATSSDVVITFPIPFPVGVLSINEHDVNSIASMSLWQFTPPTNTGCTARNICRVDRGNTQVLSPISSACKWFAKGR